MRWKILTTAVVATSSVLGQDSNLPRPTDSVINQPIYSARRDLPDDQNVMVAIAQSKDEKLRKALQWQHPAPLTLRLHYNRRIALKDADYFLCLFDAGGTSAFSPNPRVLILFTMQYKIKTWGEFDGYGFTAGTEVWPPITATGKDTVFVTMNHSLRGSGLWFEKYRITAEKIEKLGEARELEKIPGP